MLKRRRGAVYISSQHSEDKYELVYTILPHVKRLGVPSNVWCTGPKIET